MPTYPYNCLKCDQEYEAFKSIKEYDGQDPCPGCGNIGERVFSSDIQFIGASVESAEYNPGLGCVVKNKKHRDEIAKSRGLVEIGKTNGKR